MKEQSHKEEMSAALRGDFQRLRERGIPATLVPSDAPEHEPPRETEARPPASAPAAAQHAVATETAQDVHREAAPQAPRPPVSAVERADDPLQADAPPERRGWLARLVGR